MMEDQEGFGFTELKGFLKPIFHYFTTKNQAKEASERAQSKGSCWWPGGLISILRA